jgi:hypothetical protein
MTLMISVRGPLIWQKRPMEHHYLLLCSQSNHQGKCITRMRVWVVLVIAWLTTMTLMGRVKQGKRSGRSFKLVELDMLN